MIALTHEETHDDAHHHDAIDEANHWKFSARPDIDQRIQRRQHVEKSVHMLFSLVISSFHPRHRR